MQQNAPFCVLLKNNFLLVSRGLACMEWPSSYDCNAWLNLQEIGCAVFWKGAGRFVT